MPNN
jgi:Mn-dependent DtxR family transcriptional regulator